MADSSVGTVGGHADRHQFMSTRYIRPPAAGSTVGWSYDPDHPVTLSQFSSPVLVAAFEGWNDAGEAATGAVEHLELFWNAEQGPVRSPRRLLRLPGESADGPP